MRNWAHVGFDDALRLGAASSIARASEIIRLTTEAIMKPHGLTQTRHELLNVLYMSRNGELPMGKIGSRMFLHPTSVTSAVDGLERLGFVERVAHPVDRRTTLARITPAGRELLQETAPDIVATRYGLGVLDEDELRELVRLLRKVRLDNGDFVDPETEVALDPSDPPARG